MLRKLNRKKKGQNTAEYAILISLVVAAVIGMQTYVQRGLAGRLRGAVKDYMVNLTSNELGTTVQYEPYYLNQAFNITRNTEETIRLDTNITGMFGSSNVTRDKGGFQATSYNGFNLEQGI